MDQYKKTELEDFSRVVREFREARRQAEENLKNESDRQTEGLYQEEKPEEIINVPWRPAGEGEQHEII